jgi:hypothetical protein
MVIVSEVDKDRNLRIHRVSGEISIAKIKELLGTLYNSPDYDAGMNALWDLRAATTTTVTVDEVRDLATMVRSQWSGEGTSRAALVTAREPDFGMSRMYEMLVATPVDTRIMVFRDLHDGIRWLEQLEQ